MQKGIIKMRVDSRAKQLFLHFMTRCVEHDFYLPYSFVHILMLMYLMEEQRGGNDGVEVETIIDIVMMNKIVFSEQVVRNYLVTLKNFGIIEKNEKYKRRIKQEFRP